MGNLYVADTGNNRIQLFLAGQTVATTIAGITGSPGSSSVQLNSPYSVRLDNQLNLYVADLTNNRIQKFLRY
jgi:DNA-binding beta-propeller fold protein YncE